MHKNFFTLCCFLSLLDSWQVGIINLYNFVMEVMHMESDVKISVAHNEIEFAEIAALADEIWHEPVSYTHLALTAVLKTRKLSAAVSGSE